MLASSVCDQEPVSAFWIEWGSFHEICQRERAECQESTGKREEKSFLLCTISVQFSSVAQSCPTPCNPMNCSTPSLPVHHQLLEPTQTHVHRVGDAIQSSHPLLSPSTPAPIPSQHQSLFQWINSSHEVAKLSESQVQHQFFQWTPKTSLL